MYIALKILLFPFFIFPYGFVLKVGKLIGLLFYHFDKRHRLEIIERMNMSIGLRGIEDIEGTCKKFYENFGMFLVEILRMPFMSRRRIRKLVSFGELEQAKELIAEGNGLIAVTGHFSNWEYAGMSAGAYDFDVSAVAKSQTNKLFTSIFNKDAATLPTAAILQQRTKAPIAFLRLKRESCGRKFHFEIDEVIRYDESMSNEEGAKAITARMNKSYEKFIMDSPEQWLWLQRRWRFKQ